MRSSVLCGDQELAGWYHPTASENCGGALLTAGGEETVLASGVPVRHTRQKARFAKNQRRQRRLHLSGLLPWARACVRADCISMMADSIDGPDFGDPGQIV